MLKQLSILFVSIALQMWCSVSAQALSLPVVNAGFEDISGSVSVFNEFSFGAFAGWEIYDNPAGLIGNGAGNPYFVGTLQPSPDPENSGSFVFFDNGAPEGNRVAIAFNRSGTDGQGEYGLQQTLAGVPLGPNRRYRLQVEVGNIASGVAESGENFNLDGFPGYRVELLAGGQPIAADSNTLAGIIPEGEFLTSSISLVTNSVSAGLGLDLGIRLVNLNELDPLSPNADLEVDFDDVRLDVRPVFDGDYNFDGTVDSADYTVWRRSLGSSTNLSADGDDSGLIDEADFLVWRSNYGAPGTAVAGVANAVAVVPEPAAACLAGIALLTSGVLCRRRSSLRLLVE